MGYLTAQWPDQGYSERALCTGQRDVPSSEPRTVLRSYDRKKTYFRIRR